MDISNLEEPKKRTQTKMSESCVSQNVLDIYRKIAKFVGILQNIAIFLADYGNSV